MKRLYGPNPIQGVRKALSLLKSETDVSQLIHDPIMAAINLSLAALATTFFWATLFSSAYGVLTCGFQENGSTLILTAVVLAPVLCMILTPTGLLMMSWAPLALLYRLILARDAATQRPIIFQTSALIVIAAILGTYVAIAGIMIPAALHEAVTCKLLAP